MRITVELSLYPLRTEFVGSIIDYIHALRAHPGLEVVSNQMSTQVRGEFDAVMGAVNACTKQAMEQVHPLVLVAKILNADLDIGRPPTLTPPDVP